MQVTFAQKKFASATGAQPADERIVAEALAKLAWSRRVQDDIGVMIVRLNTNGAIMAVPGVQAAGTPRADKVSLSDEPPKDAELPPTIDSMPESEVDSESSQDSKASVCWRTWLRKGAVVGLKAAVVAVGIYAVARGFRVFRSNHRMHACA